MIDSNKRCSGHNFESKARPVGFACPEDSFSTACFPSDLRWQQFALLKTSLCLACCMHVCWRSLLFKLYSHQVKNFSWRRSAFRKYTAAGFWMTSQFLQIESCNSTRCVYGLAGLKRLRKLKEKKKRIGSNQHLNVKVQLRLWTIQTIVEWCFNSLLFYRYRNLPPEMRQIVSQQQQNSPLKATLGNGARTNVTFRQSTFKITLFNLL